MSDEMAREIDLEINRLLTEHRGTLKALAVALLQKETLDALEIDEIISNSSLTILA